MIITLTGLEGFPASVVREALFQEAAKELGVKNVLDDYSEFLAQILESVVSFDATLGKSSFIQIKV